MLRSLLVLVLAPSWAAALALSREAGGNEMDSPPGAVAFLAHGLKNVDRPRMLVMLGCSGSSVLMDIARGILQTHGVSTNTPGGGKSGELVKPHWNPFFNEAEGMGVALTKARDYAMQQNGTLVFKEQGAQSQAFRDAGPALLSMGTYVVHAYRRNVLDRMVCQVKDCFLSSRYGVPVGPDGKESRVCFARRSDKRKAEGYSAKLNIGRLRANLKAFLRKPDAERSRISRSGFQNYPSIVAEDLLDFEHDASAFERALITWERFMAAWGVQPKRQRIKAYLQQYVGKYSAEPQSKTIYNFEDAERICRDDDTLRQLIRK